MIYILDFLITAIAYLLIPAILAFRGKKYTKRKIKTIIVINGFVVWLLFMIVRINAGVEGTSYAVVLWGAIGYYLMKNKCMNQVCPQNIDVEQRDELSYISSENFSNKEDNTKTLKRDSAKRNSKKKKKRKKLTAIIIVLVFLLGCSIALNIIQYANILETREELIAKENEKPDYIIPDDYNTYMEFWNNNKDKLSFYDSNIVFVLDTNSIYYYTYDQMMDIVNEYEDSEFSYWAYNKEQAISLGYEKHPEILTFEEYTKRVNGN